MFSTTRRIVRYQTSSSRYRPSLSHHSDPHFTIKEALAVRSLLQEKAQRLPILGQVEHLRTLVSVAVYFLVVVAAVGLAGARSALALVRPRNDSDAYVHTHLRCP